MRTRIFTIFTVYAPIFVQLTAAFHFFYLQERGERRGGGGGRERGGTHHFTLAFWKGPILSAGPSENFLLKGDHSERDFKR